MSQIVIQINIERNTFSARQAQTAMPQRNCPQAGHLIADEKPLSSLSNFTASMEKEGFQPIENLQVWAQE